MSLQWKDLYAERSRDVKPSAIRELLKLANQPGLISFAGGIPAPEFFPYDAVDAAYHRVLGDSTKRAQALQYGISEGYPPLREIIVERFQKTGLKLGIENVCITCGSQQGLEFVGKLFIDRNTPVVVEHPTYLGALQAFVPYHPQYLPIPVDDEGIQVDNIEPALQQHPRFMYIIANFQNPSGVTLSLERRQQLVKLSHKYGVPIIEDDAYGQLRYEGDWLPSLFEIDASMHNGDVEKSNTIYLCSASKMLAPGFRVAWVVGPKTVIRHLVMLKQGSDLHTSSINQLLVYELMRYEYFQVHLANLRRNYGRRRQIMLDAMERYFPPTIRWTKPEGGMFVWATLPEHVNTEDLLQQSIEEIRVAFVPGKPFFADGSVQNTMRLNYSMMPPEKIEEGIKRLGGMLTRALEASMAEASV